MRCLVCDNNDWENVDEYRELSKHKGKPVGMSLCNHCGFISYPDKYKTEDEIREYYRKEYRGGPASYGNLITGRRKLFYHAAFLKDLIFAWRKEGKKPRFVDVGAATGITLDWFKKQVPGAEVYGVELTQTFKNTAFHEFGVELTDDIDLTKKYDLIMNYKVAEHMVDADKKIREYAEALSDNGYLYISVPTWFNAMDNSGIAGFDLEYWYHPDHINVWTRVLFEDVLRKCGLRIEKVDRLMYGDSYLCVRDDSVMSNEPQREDPKEIKAALKRIKAAWDCVKAQDPKEAIKHWGNYPSAWAFLYEKERDKLHKELNGDGLAIAEHFCQNMVKACGDTLDTRHMAADILMRYGHYPQAIEVLESVLSVRENDARALLALSNCFRAIARQEPDELKKAKLVLTARDICRKLIAVDEQARPEAYNWALKDEANISPELVKKIQAENQLTQGGNNEQI